MNMTGPHGLPIDPLLPAIGAALAAEGRLVLQAPPGAGKTTRVAPALLDQPWCKGHVWLLSPRRLAARAAAERIMAAIETAEQAIMVASSGKI